MSERVILQPAAAAAAASEHPVLFAVGINHKTAPIEIREKIYVHENETPALLARLKETLTESVVLSTCNRTEIYGVTTRADLELDFYKDLLIDFKQARGFVGREHFFGAISCAACQQIFQVATSIDSKIVGDTQILGQMREAYALATANGATGKIVNQLFQRGFKIGKMARAETSLHKGAVSVSLAAVELAGEIFGSLADKKVLVLGAGETARLTLECLVKKRVGKIFIANRTRARAEEMVDGLRTDSAANLAAEVVGFDNFKNYLNEVDIVISSTSAPEPILNKADFLAQKNKILLIDIAMPRDIAPDAAEASEKVVLKNIDDLHAIVDKNYRRRMSDLPLVQRIVMNEMTDFLVWYYSLPLFPKEMRCGAKPDAPTQNEILRVKDFLLKNASELHKMVMREGAESFAAHARVVNKLVAMKNEAFKIRATSAAARFEIEA
jgi:glutamyl-tRNA reductase